MKLSYFNPMDCAVWNKASIPYSPTRLQWLRLTGNAFSPRVACAHTMWQGEWVGKKALMGKWLLLALITCIIMGSPRGATAQETLYPYLQNVQPDAITINWLSHAQEPTSEVTFGTDPQALTHTVKGAYKRQGSFNFHTVRLTGLTPNTKYYYQIASTDQQGTLHQGEGIKSFHTLPPLGQPATDNGHLRFLILGDNQLQNNRYNRFVQEAHNKIMEKYGTANSSPDDHITMTVMVGDQVDLGMYTHYENVHFAKNRLLSAYLPIQTLVGNHETYGMPGLSLYREFFEIDEWTYQGIASGTEDFFARQVGNVLFIGFCSEKTNQATPERQLAWLDEIMQKVEEDDQVEWIISLSHRPYQTEQYIGDICAWVREQAVPRLKQSSKYILHIGAHHHNYARGQLKEEPVYHMISGGTAWDQYWGMGKEEDYDDVQKTLAQWCYQIIDIDVPNQRFSCEVYSIGSIHEEKKSELVDAFHHDKTLPAPDKPTISTQFATTHTLPLTIESSSFVSSAGEELNSTQFLISRDPSFSQIAYEVYRDYENLFGMDGRNDCTKDQNKGVNILECEIPDKALHNGTNYVKVRHRDKNMQWSEWSDVKEFTVTGSTPPPPTIEVDQLHYTLNDTIIVHFSGGSPHKKAWVGIYHHQQTPSLGSPSYVWQYTDGKETASIIFDITNGKVNNPFQSGRYYAAIFKDRGYNLHAKTPLFYVGNIPTLSLNKEHYHTEEPITLHCTEAPHLMNDAIHIFRVGDSLHTQQKPAYTITLNATEQETTLDSLSRGYYYTQYYVENTPMVIGNTLHFQVGELITQVEVDKKEYELQEPIVVTWNNAPGIPKDWIGIYPKGDNPEEDSSDESGYSYTYFDGKPSGTITIAPAELPQSAGEYFLAIFTNDSYTEISNRAYFTVIGADTNTPTPPSPPSPNNENKEEEKETPPTPPTPKEPAPSNKETPTPVAHHAVLYNVRCAPNPVQETLILWNEEPTHATLYTLTGHVVMRFALQTGENRISLLHLPQGLYILRTQYGATVKIIKE